MSDLVDGVTAIQHGELVVYPTDTVYGLGGNALDPTAINRVFTAKRRSREQPMALAVPDIETAREYITITDQTQACLDAFLPGPVTVICERAPNVPVELTGGRDRVGIRIPDHTIALELLKQTPPITATSANISGNKSVQHPRNLDPTLLDKVTTVIDDGTTPGGVSTVVDPDGGVIHRRGRRADDVAKWLTEHTK